MSPFPYPITLLSLLFLFHQVLSISDIVRDVGNTQQGASLGYTLDSACSLTFFSDNNCQHASQNFGSATKGCHDFSGTGGSWQFHC
jgi:hypothetical protein